MAEPAQAGIRWCMCCGWQFVSPDVLRVGRCIDCKSGEKAYTPREASGAAISEVIKAESGRL